MNKISPASAVSTDGPFKLVRQLGHAVLAKTSPLVVRFRLRNLERYGSEWRNLVRQIAAPSLGQKCMRAAERSQLAAGAAC